MKSNLTVSIFALLATSSALAQSTDQNPYLNNLCKKEVVSLRAEYRRIYSDKLSNLLDLEKRNLFADECIKAVKSAIKAEDEKRIVEYVTKYREMTRGLDPVKDARLLELVDEDLGAYAEPSMRSTEEFKESLYSMFYKVLENAAKSITENPDLLEKIKFKDFDSWRSRVGSPKISNGEVRGEVRFDYNDSIPFVVNVDTTTQKIESIELQKSADPLPNEQLVQLEMEKENEYISNHISASCRQQAKSEEVKQKRSLLKGIFKKD